MLTARCCPCNSTTPGAVPLRCSTPAGPAGAYGCAMSRPASHLPLWEAIAPPAPGLENADGPLRADVCVVGLGGSGLAAVLAALDRGASVVGVDAGGVAAGAAGRNGGFLLAGVARFHHRVVAEHGRERARRLYLATLSEMDAIEAATPDFVRREGSLRIAADDEELADCAAQRDAMRADGLRVDDYSGPEGSGLVFPLDGVMQPTARCRVLAASAVGRGARLVGARVESLGCGRVVTDRGRVECDQVLVCVDGWLERLVPELAGEVRSARLQMLATAPTADIDLDRPVYARDGLDYWQQLPAEWDRPGHPGRRVVLGGCRDVGGEGEWRADGEPSGDVQAALHRLLRERLRVSAQVTHRWAGVVSFSQNGLPVVRRIGDGVFVAGAYSGTGNVVGSLAGRALVELAFDGRSDLAGLLDGA